MCFTLNCDAPPTIGCEALADYTGIGWALCQRCHDRFHDGKMGFRVNFITAPVGMGLLLYMLGGQAVLLDIDIFDMGDAVDETMRLTIHNIEEWLKGGEG